MDLQLFIAINVMAFSALSIVLALLARPNGYVSWCALNGVVLLAGAGALLWLPDWAGFVAGSVFVPLIALPVTLAHMANRRATMGRTSDAAILSRLAALFHPTGRSRFHAELAAALAAEERGDVTGGLAELAQKVEPENAILVLALKATRAHDWERVLGLAGSAEKPQSDLKLLEIRALGELGRFDDQIAVFAASRGAMTGHQLALAELTLMALCGRVAATRALLDHQLRDLEPETKRYWRGVSALVADPRDGRALSVLEHLADFAERATTRSAAALKLASSPPAPSGQALQAIEALEHRLLRDAPLRRATVRNSPVTLTLLALYAIAFSAEVAMGGAEDLVTLVELGALWPPPVLQHGEWWRLLTATFLHYGPLHLAANTLLLIVLGPMTERAVGSLRFLAVYLLGGVASSAAVLALLLWLGTQDGVLVGASGALFAVFGLEAARRAVNWLRTRDSGDRRSMVLLLVILVLQFAIDLTVPEVSFTAHVTGFAVGVICGLALKLLGRDRASRQ